MNSPKCSPLGLQRYVRNGTFQTQPSEWHNDDDDDDDATSDLLC